MSKCIYTESDVTDSAAQLILTDVSLDGSVRSFAQQRFKKAFPKAYEALIQMLTLSNSNKDNKNYGVKVGDVIWTTAGGNKHLGFCVVRESANRPLNTKAVKLCMKSAREKARSLKNEYVGMDLFASDTPEEWSSIVGIIEDNLEEIQGVVCVPTNRDLLDVLDFLPGSKKFTMIKSQ